MKKPKKKKKSMCGILRGGRMGRRPGNHNLSHFSLQNTRLTGLFSHRYMVVIIATCICLFPGKVGYLTHLTLISLMGDLRPRKRKTRKLEGKLYRLELLFPSDPYIPVPGH